MIPSKNLLKGDSYETIVYIYRIGKGKFSETANHKLQYKSDISVKYHFCTSMKAAIKLTISIIQFLIYFVAHYKLQLHPH